MKKCENTMPYRACSISVIYVGSWGNREQRGHGNGISAFVFHEETGGFTYIDTLEGVEEPGTLTVSPDNKYLYCANEMTKFPKGEYAAGGGISAMRIEQEKGRLQLINQTSSLGSLPAYVCMDTSGKYVCCSNHASFAVISTYLRNNNGEFTCQKKYDSSGIALFKVGGQGEIQPGSDLIIFQEPGSYHIYKENMEMADHHFPGNWIESPQIFQSSSHAHSINFDKNGVGIVCDRGTDMLHMVRIDEKKNCFIEGFTCHTRLGSAPRHLVFHPKLPCFYVVNELESTVSVYEFNEDRSRFGEVQVISTLVEGNITRNAPSDIRIHPSGKFVYASNHGDNSIAVYQVHNKTGRLLRVQVLEMEGIYPRGIGVSPKGNYLVVGNMDSDSITSYKIDEVEGTLLWSGHTAKVDTPTSIQFAQLKQ